MYFIFENDFSGKTNGWCQWVWSIVSASLTKTGNRRAVFSDLTEPVSQLYNKLLENMCNDDELWHHIVSNQHFCAKQGVKLESNASAVSD